MKNIHLFWKIAAAACLVLSISVVLHFAASPSTTAIIQAAAGPQNPTVSSTWPMFGGTPQRNMANITDKGIVTDWNVEEGKQKNIKWMAQLGRHTYGGPVVVGGKVYVGTNNDVPRDPKNKGKDKAVLMAFSEADGKFLWQIVHDIPALETFLQVMNLGLLSTPTVDGKRLYYVTPSCEVICADSDKGEVLWRYDMMKELKVIPLHCGNCSPLVVGERIFVVTGNGRNEAEVPKVPFPKAPSFIALNKNNGKLLWQNNLPGENIIAGQWSNPTLATVGGKDQIIFPGGDSALYSLEPETGKMIWKFQCPSARTKGDDPNSPNNYPIGTPVVVGDRVYIGLGVYPDGPPPLPFSHFLCVDITKTGDISSTIGLAGEVNKNSALVWSHGAKIEPRPERGRQVTFRSTLSTAAIHDGLVFIAEDAGYVHCLDAKTGQRYWEYDLKAGAWGSPYYVDGKIFQGNDQGTVFVFDASKKLKVIGTPDLDEHYDGTPIVAGGVLYIATGSKLYAIAEKK